MSENNGAETLYLMQAEIDLNHLNTWMGKRQVEHSGRAMHCLLTETLGDAAPSQFRVMSQRSRNAATLYGYTRHDAKQLIHNHRAFATPQQEQVMPADSMATKAMPDQWTDGTNLAFDVLCRPIRQRVKHEVDAFKSMQEAAPEADITRQEAYLRLADGILRKTRHSHRSKRQRGAVPSVKDRNGATTHHGQSAGNHHERGAKDHGRRTLHADAG